MTSIWRKYAQEELWVHPIDQHPNDFAHDLVAKKILNHISKRDIEKARLN
jgi:hypothetical protein